MAIGQLTAVDYVIFGLMLVISASIGIFYGCFGSKNATAKELLIANRQMTVITLVFILKLKTLTLKYKNLILTGISHGYEFISQFHVWYNNIR